MDSLKFKLKYTEKNLLPLINDESSGYKVEKCSKLSTSIRNEGNNLYNLNRHDEKIHLEILTCYTKCISYAPSGSEELAMGYSNRSMLLFHLGKYENCMVDIERALPVTKLNWLKVKLLVRKVECMVLGELYCHDEYRSLDVWKILNDAKCFLHKVDGVNIKMKDDLKRLVRNAEKTVKKFYNKNAAPRQKAKLSKNAQFPGFAKKGEIPCGSDAIALKYCDEFGRHLTATRDIKPGEILLIEDGFLYLHPANCYMACSHCFEGIYNGIPCNSCVFAVYCSEKCKEDAWISYHDEECTKYDYYKIMRTFTGSDRIIILLMLLRKMLILTMKKTKDKFVNHLYSKFFGNGADNDKRTRGLKTADKLDGLTFEACGNLVSHFDKNETDLLYLPFVYMLSVDLLSMESDSDVEKMLHLATQAVEKFTQNSYSYELRSSPCVCEFEGKSRSDGRLHPDDCIRMKGVILAPFCTLVNHSCVNNAGFITVNGKMVLYAQRAIKADEQIFINYGFPKLEMSASERRQAISSRYHFTCNCEACRENWPVPTKKEADEADASGFEKLNRNLKKRLRDKLDLLDFDSRKWVFEHARHEGGTRPELVDHSLLFELGRKLDTITETINDLFARNSFRSFVMKSSGSIEVAQELSILKEVLYYDEEHFDITVSCSKM